MIGFYGFHNINNIIYSDSDASNVDMHNTEFMGKITGLDGIDIIG